MKKALKKIVDTFALTALMLSSAVPTFASDLSQHWAEPYMTKLIAHGFMQGYEDGTYRPERTMNRAEFVTLMNRVFAFPVTALNNPNLPWYANQVLAAQMLGYYFEEPASTGLPERPLTPEEVAVMVNNIYRLPPSAEALNYLNDADTIAPFAKNAVSALVEAGIVVGDENRNYNPKKILTRAEASTFIVQTIGDVITDRLTTDKIYEGNVLINSDNVNLKDVEIKGNLFISHGAASGNIDFTNVQVGGLVTVQGASTLTVDSKTSFGSFSTRAGTTVNGTKVKRAENVTIEAGKIRPASTSNIITNNNSNSSNVHYGSGSSNNGNSGGNVLSSNETLATVSISADGTNLPAMQNLSSSTANTALVPANTQQD